ncbi:DUF2933 domain-containing protein [Pontibacterium granulatum]|uniref:DUF2933 domain-containing protein n=1 Tax=Pontibacterium granulatum TaxID=2036029 RepID=UPI00249B0C65|nr:DUF2933 domain-containing protein [Pontibacterium granulatum]MDI3326310.1 DUF2933 domain-containing protein [Pontibacterium granulatum]
MGKHAGFWRSPKGLFALIFIGVLGFFLLSEHFGHIFPFLPYLFLFLCPLMHLFMHGEHAQHTHNESDTEISKEDKAINFSEESQKNEAYRKGYIEGLKTARYEAEKNTLSDK